jgi:predicted GNAT family acetyltransferase
MNVSIQRMRVIRHTNREEFAARVMPFLLQREMENGLFIGFIPTPAADPLDVLKLSAETDAGEVVTVALMTPPKHLIVTSAPPEAIDALARHLIDQRIDLPGVQTRRDLAQRFADTYCRATGAAIRERSGMAIHVLQAITPVHGVEGALRAAGPGDIERLASWMEAFAGEVHDPALGDYREMAAERVALGRIFLWQHGDEPVSMAALAGPTPNGIRISFVFTPHTHRNRGYASACVAALSQRALDSGRKFCFLYTDLANTTSNKIYRAIGYEKICEDEKIFFSSATT